MRKLIVVNMVSLDGYYAGPDGDVSSMAVGDGFNEYNVERLESATTVLVGGNSFRAFGSYWPGKENDAGASANERDFARAYSAVGKVAVSRNLSGSDVPDGGKARSGSSTRGLTTKYAA